MFKKKTKAKKIFTVHHYLGYSYESIVAQQFISAVYIKTMMNKTIANLMPQSGIARQTISEAADSQKLVLTSFSKQSKPKTPPNENAQHKNGSLRWEHSCVT